MIEVKNLTKKYGPDTAVDQLSFTVEKGQIYGFLGPNGAGKSTTMNIMTGYIAPTSGQVLINGHDIVEDGQEARKCIGYLPEIPPVYPEMTVEEYLAYAAGLKQIPGRETERMIMEAMDMTGTLEVRKRLIRNLSKGFRQRVGQAQAILGYPDIIILDEPMAGLDPKQIIEIRELIKKLSEKHTVILSSHILSEVSAICDHILIIAHGKLVASDTPDNLTSLMKGSATLELTVEGNQEEIHTALKKTDVVSEYNIKPSAEKNAVDIEMKARDGEDIRREIFFLFSELHFPILRMQHTHVSLEDIFLELTEEHPEEMEEKGEQKKRFGLIRRKERNHGDHTPEHEAKEGQNHDSSL